MPRTTPETGETFRPADRDEWRTWLQAKRNGQWDRALQRESTAGLPADLAEALDGVEGGRAAFGRLPPSHRRRYLAWIEEARRPETRARRIAETVRRAREFSEGNAG